LAAARSIVTSPAGTTTASSATTSRPTPVATTPPAPFARRWPSWAPLGAGTSSDAGAGCLTRAHILLAAIEGDRYPAVRHLAARALGQLLAAAAPAGADVVRTALAIDATGEESARAEARRADIDIGE